MAQSIYDYRGNAECEVISAKHILSHIAANPSALALSMRINLEIKREL